MMNGKHMSVIQVSPDGKKFKVMVNYVKRGVSVNKVALANKIAQSIKDNELPCAELIPFEV